MHIAVSRVAFGMLEDLLAYGGKDTAPSDAGGMVALNQLRRAELVELTGNHVRLTALGRYMARVAASQRDLAVVRIDIPEESVRDFLDSKSAPAHLIGECTEADLEQGRIPPGDDAGRGA
jgi:hypothetical protein